DVAAVGHRLDDLRRATAGSGERDTLKVVDQLGVDVFATAKHTQPRTLRRAGDVAAHMLSPAQLPALLGFLLVHVSSRKRRPLTTTAQNPTLNTFSRGARTARCKHRGSIEIIHRS